MFWVAQRFTAAITGLFSEPASAAEVRLQRGRMPSRDLLGMTPQWNATDRKVRDEWGTA
jgi:hypothetical protein